MNNWDTEIICDGCGKKAHKRTGAVNRSRREGRPVFCTRQCFVDTRKTTKADKIEVKRIYDLRYSKENAQRIKERNQIYNETPAGRAMQKRNRDKFTQRHLEYCRTPEYRKWKKEYDIKHRAKKNYGEFWESFILLQDIESHIDKYEVSILNNNYNKSQKRKRNEVNSAKLKE